MKCYLKPVGLNYRPSLRGPCVKNENLVFHSMAWAIWLINSLWYGKYLNILTLSNQGETAWRKNFPQYRLNGSRYCKEILQVYFYIIQDCFECFRIFFCLHTLPWQLFFQLVNELRNEQSYLDSMILTNLVGGTYGFSRKSTKNIYYDVNMT